MSNYTSNDSYLNPFDDDQHQFVVLTNSQDQYSLWPVFAPMPAGWEQRFGPAGRNLCLDYIELHWQAINPFQAAS